MNISKKSKLFGCLLLLFMIYPYYKIIFCGGLENNGAAGLMLMWAPGIAGIISSLVYNKSLKGLKLKIKKPKYIALAYVIPIVAAIIVYGIVWVTGLSDGINSMSIIKILIMATLGVLISILSAAGEEIGWRGFLLGDLLEKNSFRKTSWIISIVWFIYHMPAILFSDYHSNAPKLFALVCFGISVIAVTFIANVLTIKSDSVWPAIILHASHNLFIQQVFDAITKSNDITQYFTTEFGIGLALIYTIVAVVLVKGVKLNVIDNQNENKEVDILQ